MNVAESNEISISNISSMHFQLSRIDGTSIVTPIRLHEDGTIYFHSHDND